MTVKQLIEILSKLPAEMQVGITYDASDYACEDTDVSTVEGWVAGDRSEVFVLTVSPDAIGMLTDPEEE